MTSRLALLCLVFTFIGFGSAHAFTGSSGSVAPGASGATGELTSTVRPVIAYIDTGINPYHVRFRDASVDDHPAAFVPGYPGGAFRLSLSLGAPDYETAVAADQATWDSQDAGKLYYIPGTRIIGAISLQETDLPILDEDGHGTLVADAGSGFPNGVAPESYIVVIRGRSDLALDWVRGQPWIDVVSFSRAHIGNAWPFGSPNQGGPLDINSPLVPSYSLTSEGRSIFVAAGNGPPGSTGQTFMSDFLPPWVFAVGGMAEIGPPYNVRELCELCDRPFEAAANYQGRFATIETMDGISTQRQIGTSIATPRMAGWASLLIADARIRLGYDGNFHDGAYARAASGVVVPARGPLSDGLFNRTELEELLRQTAGPLPFFSVFTGTVEIPEETRYWYEGYGGVYEETYKVARSVLLGVTPWPAERPWDDYWHSVHDEMTGRWYEAWVCRSEERIGQWTSCPHELEDPARLAGLMSQIPAPLQFDETVVEEQRDVLMMGSKVEPFGAEDDLFDRLRSTR